MSSHEPKAGSIPRQTSSSVAGSVTKPSNNATPTPWEVTTGSNPISFYIVHRALMRGKRHSSYMVCAVGESTQAKADAALIVRAVNAHAALVEACQKAQAVLKLQWRGRGITADELEALNDLGHALALAQEDRP